jgi:hypothetical protein
VIPVEALFSFEDEEGLQSGGLILFARDGWLTELEVFNSGASSKEIPEVRELSVYHRDDPENPVTYHGVVQRQPVSVVDRARRWVRQLWARA